MSSNIGKLKPMPSLSSDEQAEAFVDTADLSTYDLSGFRPVRFEMQSKTTELNFSITARGTLSN